MAGDIERTLQELFFPLSSFYFIFHFLLSSSCGTWLFHGYDSRNEGLVVKTLDRVIIEGYTCGVGATFNVSVVAISYSLDIVSRGVKTPSIRTPLTRCSVDARKDGS